MNKSSFKIIKVITVTLVFLAIIFVIFSVAIRGLLNSADTADYIDSNLLRRNYSSDIIKSSYPNYQHMDREEALSLFKGVVEPGNRYEPFVVWRTNPYRSPNVNVEPKFQARMSLGHSLEESVWFLGGSAVWGIGVSDETTIPSYFSKITGENVLNLGEHGYVSFQSLLQLEGMLVRGFVPKAVVFYEGFNDLPYCFSEAETPLPTHLANERILQMSSEYGRLRWEVEILRAQTKKEGRPSADAVLRYFNGLFHSIFEPYGELVNNYINGKTATNHVNSELKSDRKFSEFETGGTEKLCGRGDEQVHEVVSVTVETWLLSHDLLKRRGIPSYYFLQPSAAIKPESLQLDYLVNQQKSQIAELARGEERRTEAIVKAWEENCADHGACDRFFDISEALVGFEEPVFIDAMNVSPNGNEYIAKIIADIVLKNK